MNIHKFLFIILLFFSISLYATETSLPGMPPVTNPRNIYSNANVGMFSPVTKQALQRVYVPNTVDNTVSVIDPKTYTVIATFPTNQDPEHIVPAYDLKTIWVLNDNGNSITPIDPNTSKPGKAVQVQHPYNLYYTPDGRFAIIVDDILKRLDFYDPHTMALIESVPVKCEGMNHMDFTANGRYAIASCEYSGILLKLDVSTHKVIGYLTLNLKNSNKHPMPQDIRSSPDGRVFYVADMISDGVFLVDPVAFRQIGFMPAGKGTHSIYPSRNGKLLYVSNRGCNKMNNCPTKGPGSISVIDPLLQKIVATWPIPGGGSPDMGNLSSDGKELWLSGKYDHEVYVFNTTTGELMHRIPVGQFPHGLTYWPQPGRYSLGHTGNMR
jgi:YVTN family beta-propeller protein